MRQSSIFSGKQIFQASVLVLCLLAMSVARAQDKKPASNKKSAGGAKAAAPAADDTKKAADAPKEIKDLPTAPSFSGDPYAAIIKYKFGENREPMTVIELEIQKGKPEQIKAVEAKLIKCMTAPEATFECKQWICRMLRRIGSEAAVPVLAAMLKDEKLCNCACMALQEISGEAASAALRDGLGQAPGNCKLVVIASIAIRNDRKAVPALAPLAGGVDPALATAAIEALGHIGGEDAAKALAGVKAGGDLAHKRDGAIVKCYEPGAGGSEAAGAAAAYRDIIGKSPSWAAKAMALRGLVRVEKDKAAPLVVAALKDSNKNIRQAAGSCVSEIPASAEASKELSAGFASMPPDSQVMLLNGLERRGDKTALPAVASALKSGDAAIRAAAISASAKLGDASIVDALVPFLEAKGPEADATVAALTSMQAEGINEALTAKAKQAQGEAAVRIIALLGARNAVSAAPMLIEMAGGANKDTRGAAWKALLALAGPDQLPALLDALSKLTQDSELKLAQKTIVNIALKTKDRDKNADLIIARIAAAPKPVQAALLCALGSIGGANALKTLKQTWNGADEQLKEAAVRGLADWPDDSAATDLLGIAQSAQDEKHRALALRGYARIASQPAKGRTPDETLKMLRNAMGMCKRADDKKMVLSGLQEISSLETLQMAVGCLDDPAVSAEAGIAVYDIARGLRDKAPAEANAAIKKAAEVCKNDKNLVKDFANALKGKWKEESEKMDM